MAENQTTTENVSNSETHATHMSNDIHFLFFHNLQIIIYQSTVQNILFGEVYRQIYSQNFCFTATDFWSLDKYKLTLMLMHY